MGIAATDDGPITRGGKRLAAWMKDNRRSQQWIADQVSTHQTNVSAWLKKRPIPLDKAIAVRDLTGIPVEDWAVPADAESSPVDVTDTAQKAG